MSESVRPLPVRVLRLAGCAALVLSLVAFAIGALLSFRELAKVWAVVAGILFLTAIASFFGARPSRIGLVSAMIACTLMLLLPPVGTILTIAIALLASQKTSELRDYYGLRRRTA